MLGFIVSCTGATSCQTQRSVEMKFTRRKFGQMRPYVRLRPRPCVARGRVVPGKKASQQHTDPVRGSLPNQIGVACERALDRLPFIVLIVTGAKSAREAPQRPNKTKLVGNHISCVAELHLTNFMEACLNRYLCFCERVARCQHERVQINKAVALIDEISSPAGGVKGAP